MFQVYEYRGASAAGDLVAGYPSDLLNADADEAHHRIRTHLFYRFFKVILSKIAFIKDIKNYYCVHAHIF